MDSHQSAEAENELKLKNIFLKLFTRNAKNGHGIEELRKEFIKFFDELQLPVANEQLQMILNTVRLRDYSAEQIKIPVTAIVALPENASLKETVKIINGSGHSRIPVYRETEGRREYTGILYVKDLIHILGERKGRFKLESYVKEFKVVPETQSLLSLLRDMRTNHYHIVLTADEYGEITGLVTLEDILEEIVGDIRDEYDDKEKLVTPVGVRHYRVNARIPLTELNQELALNLPEEKFNTLAGFILHELKGELREDSRVEYGKAVFIVEKFKDNEVQSVIIKIRSSSH